MIDFELDELPLVYFSRDDVKFDKHRREADKVSRLIRGSNEPITPENIRRSITTGGDLSKRIYRCARDLMFKQCATGIKLYHARFCRARCCPICQWRRSLVWRARVLEKMPKILDDYQDYNWVFLTLTVRNCHIKALKYNLDKMRHGWYKLMGVNGYKSRFPQLGYLKTFEVTMAKNKTAHPHYHALIMLPPDYYQGQYISQEQLVRTWRQSLKLDYNPMVGITAVHEIERGVLELIKYVTKPAHLFQSRSWLLEYNRQVYGYRFIERGGLFRSSLQNIDNDPQDLININDEKSTPLGSGFSDLTFRFNDNLKRYCLI